MAGIRTPISGLRRYRVSQPVTADGFKRSHEQLTNNSSDARDEDEHRYPFQSQTTVQNNVYFESVSRSFITTRVYGYLSADRCAGFQRHIIYHSAQLKCKGIVHVETERGRTRIRPHYICALEVSETKTNVIELAGNCESEGRTATSRRGSHTSEGLIKGGNDGNSLAPVSGGALRFAARNKVVALAGIVAATKFADGTHDGPPAVRYR